MTPGQFLLALRARRRAFLLVLAATLCAAAAVTALMPRSYKATVSLLLDWKDEQSMGNGLQPLAYPQERLSYLQTQSDILTSAKVARRVVQDLKLAQDPLRLEQFNRLPGRSDTLDEWIAMDLLRNFKVDTSQSNVIHASFVAGEPRQAARIANAFARAYIDTMLELRVEPTREAAAWFDEQLKGLRAGLEEAQKRLTAYAQRQGITSSDERFDLESARLTAAQEQAARGREQASQWASRAAQARSLLDQGVAAERLPEVLDNPFIQRLKSDLLRGEARLQELATQYGPRHPQYQRQEAENQSLRDKLEAETRKVVAGVEASAAQNASRAAGQDQAVSAQRARVLRLKEGRNDLTVLKRNVDSAERAYDSALQRAAVSRVESRASQTNVSVLNPAQVPAAPFRPRVLLNLLLALAAGAALGCGAVLVLESLDPRLRSAGGLRAAGELPLLAELGEWRPAEARG